HPSEHGHPDVNIVVHLDDPLIIMKAMQPSDVLLQCSLPRNWHCQKESIEPRMVESLSDVAARSNDHPTPILGQALEFINQRHPLLRSQPSSEMKKAGDFCCQSLHKPLGVIRPLC